AGLVLSTALLVAIGYAQTLSHVIVLVMCWQIGLNMMLAPLIAWAGDCFPDEQKGTLGGFLAFAPAIGAMAGSLVTFEILVPSQWRLVAVAGLVVASVTPALIFGRRQTRPALMRPVYGQDRADEAHPYRNRSVAVRMWSARFLVQISEAGLFAFLLFWMRSIIPDFHENTAANIFSLVLIAAVPVSLWLGSWSDRSDRPITPLVATAALSSVGLLMMAFSGGTTTAIAGYVVFGIAATVFLSLHTGQTLRVLPKPQHRGRDLGVFNLTNTVPSLVMPWLTLTLVPSFGFSALFVCFAVLVALGAGVLVSVAKPVSRA
ncbi:MAG: MFS transporter, partial [Pseudomonadota bacterium]